MIFETLAAMADLNNNSRIDNNATREECQETGELLNSQFKLPLVTETLTIGSITKVVNDANRLSYHIYAIQKKLPRSIVEPDLEQTVL